MAMVVIAAGACSAAVTPSAIGARTSPTIGRSPGAAASAVGSAAATTAGSDTELERVGPTGPTQLGAVVRVVDGDTIIVRVGGAQERLRYIGMNAPETVKPNTPVQWMGPEASAANHRLVDGQTVTLEKDVSERDRFGRLLRDVWLRSGDRWLLVNLELVRLGYASVSTFPPDVKYVPELLAAERAARTGEAGLWGPTPAP